LVGPPILAASFVGPKRTAVVGLAALAAAVGYGRAVGVDLLARSQAVPWRQARHRAGQQQAGLGAGAAPAPRPVRHRVRL
jgi:uncharacterized membrane protein